MTKLSLLCFKAVENILTTRVLLVSLAGLEATPAENGGAYPWD